MNWLLPLLLLLGSNVPSDRGVRECANCHPTQARPHPGTSMSHALETVAECKILRDHRLLTFAAGKFRYQIERKGEESIYSVTDGGETITAPVLWAFGLGTAGQTYVFEHGGELFQSRVSYYASIGALDLTIGAQNLAPQNLWQAAGQMMDGGEKLRCVGCHSTNSAAGRTLTLDQLTPGVQCDVTGRARATSEASNEVIRRQLLSCGD